MIPPRFLVRPSLRTTLAICSAGGLSSAALVAFATAHLNPVPAWSLGHGIALSANLLALYIPLALLFGLTLTLLTAERTPWAVRWPRLGHTLSTARAFAAWIPMAAGILIVPQFALQPAVGTGGGEPSAYLEGELSAPEEDPPPLTLLVIDGATLDVIVPMVEAGELPTFAALMQNGTWGSLGSQIPTLSPALWTTLATGVDPTVHGVRGFVYTQLPGLSRPVARFPRGSTLNYGFVPWLDRYIPGFGQPPYTSRLIQRRTLWDIVGERHTVGVYRWLVSWPALPVNGFLVAGGSYASVGPRNLAASWNPKAREWLKEARAGRPGLLQRSLAYPETLLEDSSLPPKHSLTTDAVASYATDTTQLDPKGTQARLISSSLADNSLDEMVYLSAKFKPNLLMASFCPVDQFQHRFSQKYVGEEPWAPAIAQRYRDCDRQLGELIATLDANGHLLVISDHGFDFAVDSHWKAPPGILFAQGPRFEPGRRVDDLSLIDVAPLSLYLLGFPIPDDTPGGESGRFTGALKSGGDPHFERISTYERTAGRSMSADDAFNPDAVRFSDEMEHELRSLGYLQ